MQLNPPHFFSDTSEPASCHVQIEPNLHIVLSVLSLSNATLKVSLGCFTVLSWTLLPTESAHIHTPPFALPVSPLSFTGCFCLPCSPCTGQILLPPSPEAWQLCPIVPFLTPSCLHTCACARCTPANAVNQLVCFSFLPYSQWLSPLSPGEIETPALCNCGHC